MFEIIERKEGEEENRCHACKILLRSSPTPLFPLHHLPGMYQFPNDPTTPPVSLWGVPYPSLLALALADPETAHLELHPFSLPL
jgi:hypothetical protein